MYEGPPATAREEFYLEWARESAKAAIKNATDANARLVSLSASMLGGGLAFLRETAYPPLQWVMHAAFFAALVAALWGSTPYGASVEMDPGAIRVHKSKVLEFREWLLKVATVALLIGFVVAVVAVGIGKR